MDQPSFHAETCSLRICTTFLPDVYISGGDGAPFLSVQSASYKWEGVLSNCMEDMKCIPCGTYANVFEGRLLHIYLWGRKELGSVSDRTGLYRLGVFVSSKKWGAYEI